MPFQVEVIKFTDRNLAEAMRQAARYLESEYFDKQNIIKDLTVALSEGLWWIKIYYNEQ